MERLTGAGWEDKDVWAAALAISEVELFELRVPWTERLAALPVESVAEPLLDLLAIDGSGNPGNVPPHMESR